MADGALTIESVSASERGRFIEAHDGDTAAAAAAVAAHLEWRALNLPHERPAHRPEWAHWHGTALDGTRVLHGTPARCDTRCGTVDEYVLDLVGLLDSGLDREIDERVTVLLDLRGGNGWANPPATQAALPLARGAIRLVAQHLPERIGRVVIYPVPWALSGLWQLAKPALGARAAARVVILRGPARPGPDVRDELLSSPPALAKYVDYRAFRDDQAARHQDMRRRESSASDGDGLPRRHRLSQLSWLSQDDGDGSGALGTLRRRWCCCGGDSGGGDDGGNGELGDGNQRALLQDAQEVQPHG